MSMAVETLPISQAAQALSFPEALLRHLVGAGVIAGDKSTCDLDQAAQVVARLRAVQAPVSGNPVLVSKAIVQYGFSTPSIYKWIAGGWIKVLQPEPLILIDEGDICLARELASIVGIRHGRSVFPAKPRSGRPRKIAV